MKTVSVEIPEDLYNRAQESLSGRGLTIEAFVRVALRGALQQTGFIPLHGEITFGKYRGESLETVIRANPEYVRWLLSNSRNFSTDEAAIELLEMITGTGAKKKRKAATEEVEKTDAVPDEPVPSRRSWFFRPSLN